MLSRCESTKAIPEGSYAYINSISPLRHRPIQFFYLRGIDGSLTALRARYATNLIVASVVLIIGLSRRFGDKLTAEPVAYKLTSEKPAASRCPSSYHKGTAERSSKIR